MKRKGFSLTELMIALAIFSIISLFLYQTFFSQIRQSFNFNYNIDIQRNVNKALEVLTDEIRNNSYTNITIESTGLAGETQIKSNGTTIIDFSLSATGKVNYDRASKVLRDNNGNECTNIDSIQIVRGNVGDNENDLLLITVSASEGRTQIVSSTAVNFNK